MTALALTEHGNISSHVKLEQAAVKAGIKPIFGCELYTGSGKTKRKNHLTVLAQTPEGYQNLLRLVSWAWKDGFYYEPTVSGEALARYNEGLIVLSGCTGSLLSTSLTGGKNIRPEDASYKRAKVTAERFKEMLGDRFYLEVQTFPELDNTKQVNTAWEQLSKEIDVPLVATSDVHYTKPDENEMQVILHSVRPGGKRTAEEQARSWGYDVPLCPPLTDREVLERLRGTGLSRIAAAEALATTAEIAGRCNVTLPKADPIRFPVEGKTSQQVWLEWMREGWDFRRIDDKPRRDEYVARVKYEMSIIEQKEFIDYFLVVSDVVKYAKDHGIPVGPARGSAAGSLVCYLLRITEVDPLLYADLIFERFVDITRIDLPDIDLDFDDERRGEIRQYLARKYGADKVGTLGTFVTYKSKNSLDDVARVFKVPPWEVDKVKELLIERSSGDLRASATIEDTVEMFKEAKQVFEEHPKLYNAMKLEGNIKGMSTHAAGLVVANTPLTDVCAVYTRKVGKDTNEFLSVDKYDAEYLGMLKIDILGLSTMGMIRIALDIIGMELKDLYELPLDDPVTIAGFQANDTIGVFQFDGRAMRLVNASLRPDNFYEVCVVNALARPGPLHNNASTDYADIKRGHIKPTKLHPIFDNIVEPTKYQVVYQEQILRILREIGDFDWTSLMQVRKIISRKVGEQAFNRFWLKFLNGAKDKGLSQETAKKIWGMCITAGAYAFNAAHSVSYGMLAYWTMWLKMHHPVAFYTAALRKLQAKEREILRDAAKHGIPIYNPDINRSAVSWTPEGNGIRAGFVQIKGIGVKMAQTIVTYRESWRSKTMNAKLKWADLIEIKGIGPKTVERIAAFAEQEDPFDIYVLARRLKSTVKAIKKKKLLGAYGQPLPIPTHNAAQVPHGRGENVHIVWLGTIVQRNLRDLYEVNMSRTGEPLDPSKVKDPELREWVLMQGADGEDLVTINIDRWKYPRFKEVVWKINQGKDLVLVRGKKKGALPYKIIHADEMWVIS